MNTSLAPAIEAPQPDRVGAAMAEGLRAVADMVETADPAVLHELRYVFDRMLVCVGTREAAAALARAGVRAGAIVTKHQDGKWAGVDLLWGPVSLHVYAGREQMCERIVVGTHEETKQVPDPELLAAVPTLTVTEVVEDVQWRCRPLDGAQ